MATSALTSPWLVKTHGRAEPRTRGGMRSDRVLKRFLVDCRQNLSLREHTSCRLGPGNLRAGFLTANQALASRKVRSLECAAKGGKGSRNDACLYVEVEADGSDAWRLDPVIDLLRRGGVGIIPTDTLYAFVCDINNSKAVDLMYKIKDLSPAKPLSILCRTFSDIDFYTKGFPSNGSAGSTNVFRLAKQSLPGPFTLILPASKNVPARCFKKKNGDTTCKLRREVGVRMPADPICQDILSQLDAALLCTSVRADDASPWFLEPAFMVEEYGKRGLSFVVDGGTRPANPSTVVDVTQGDPIIVRAGQGDTTIWEGVHLDGVSALTEVYAKTEEDAYVSKW
uniref:Threonylcarbamoyl-AMP synthase n=1 Tax=Pyramimonas obovata TaxID=1411642 RepID=A0A6T7YBQ0_9CHLO|mmetsp:Transcript_37277/g.81170  ORF Transcript_37277/g.81170 Transcript_37277/m.81170 type:complete len:340 (+) Transcript_37277:153-1172(+)|eukprot:CAMPEP_0118933970 /NCGR_PEP_ID=MMETSP1169-20130426/13157_1 /TAXON_ID=36882 /ORGANISM="Pyramimonas obovata, Strain CCMP722" /LENGTH=339 /DNA_ID=CAMNT_0006876817 /DNA_START=148 /DNA_END=1164 /DNA_ORIENTATION=+